MIDTHAHLDFPDFDPIRADLIARYFSHGGEALVNVGCDMASSQRSVELSMAHENIYAAVGIHPHDAQALTPENLVRLEELLLRPKTVAVGEIGLDFYREPFNPPARQIEAFRAQLELADLHQQPIIIHCREAYAETLEVLRSYKTKDWRGVLHCFTAGPEVAAQFLELGFYIGFTGVVTYYKPGSRDESFLLDTLKMMPLDRLLVETDAPYLAPVPHRGETNEPLFVRHVIERIAQLRGLAPEGLERETSANARRLFGIA